MLFWPGEPVALRCSCVAAWCSRRRRSRAKGGREEVEHTALQRALEAEDVLGREVRRLVEGDGAIAVLGKDAVEDDDVEVEVGVEGGAEAVQEAVSSPQTLRARPVKVRGDTLTFWASPDGGDRGDCRLTRRADGAFEGPCGPDREENIRMLMVPPGKDL